MKLQEVIVLTASYYSKDITEPLLKMYLEDLADLDPEACIAAYNSYRRDPKNRSFPLPAQIREIVSPEQFISPEIEAREIAARIVGAVSRFGWNNAKDAEQFIGPVGWGAVSRSGGWSIICEQMSTFNKTTIQAQMRDLLEGSIRYGEKAIDNKIKIAPRNLPGELVQANFARLLGEKPEGEE